MKLNLKGNLGVYLFNWVLFKGVGNGTNRITKRIIDSYPIFGSIEYGIHPNHYELACGF